VAELARAAGTQREPVTSSRGEPLLDEVGAPPAPGGILLVDDHRENLAALEAVLEPLGEPVISVDSGEAALRVLLHREVAVILLDVRMSGIDGVETARLVRSRPATRHIPIIFLTALASDAEQIELAYATGAVDYVIKPFEPSILRAKVTAFVALSRERAERLRQSRARARAEAAARAVRTLQSLSDAALAHLELEPLANQLLDRACSLFDAAGGALLLGDPADEQLTALAARGFAPPLGVVAVDGPVGELLDRREALRLGPDDPAWPVLAPAGAAVAVAVPLHDDGELAARGLLVLGSDAPDAFDRADIALLGLAGDRITIAVDHAQRFEHQRQLVETLQRSLLPDRLPEHPRLEFAARYRPGESGARIGGDWYDAIALDERRVALMIGDVVGHGIRAAARMGELRNALRAYATEGHGPGAALHRLERMVGATGTPGMVATVLFGVLDLETRAITLSRAGHPPPLVRAVDGTVRVLDSGSTLPLGVIGTAAPTEFTYALADGETLLLYTDGLVERRSEPVDAGIDRLMTALGSGAGTAEASCERVLERLIGERPPGDDVALLAVHVRAPQSGPLELDLPARATSVTTARHQLREWLRREAPELDPLARGDFEVAFCEACTNVVRHAYGPGDAAFRAVARHDGRAIELIVEDRGHWRAPRPRGGGRGLDLIRALCDELTIDRGADGTRVTMRWSRLG
jgi:serine phosphatase RsbU (regulator of sigma subunit)/DNA-binding response OmpR family regulator/anti-sigma regulatory factor (Ser/Thr protein kinase)